MATSARDDCVFVARQPILDSVGRLFAYELLFRPAVATPESGLSARVVTDAILDIGLDTLTHGRPAFIDVTRQFLLDGIPLVLPPTRVIVRLLDEVGSDDEVVRSCTELHQKGYAIAVADALSETGSALLPHVDFAHIALARTSDAAARDVLNRLAARGRPALIAQGIEDAAQFEEARRCGFRYFKGFFFGHPAVHAARTVPAHLLGRFRILRELHGRDLTIDRIEALVEQDAVICYRLLRLVNSAGFAQRSEIQTLRQALVLLGTLNVRRWLSVWLLDSVSEGSHPELAAMSAIRARCCELLAGALHDDAPADAFLLGMCSMLDVILQRPMPAILDQLPLSDATTRALCGENNRHRQLLDCVIAYERGQWDECLRLAGLMTLDPVRLHAAHKQALQWTNGVQQAA